MAKESTQNQMDMFTKVILLMDIEKAKEWWDMRMGKYIRENGAMGNAMEQDGGELRVWHRKDVLHF